MLLNIPEGVAKQMMDDISKLVWTDPPTGEQLRDAGMKQAVDHADQVHERWSDKAYAFLLAYLRSGMEFMAEDVRAASEGIVPEPPSKRAWGSIIRRAAKAGLIRKIGCCHVKNPGAHMANANRWKHMP